MFGDNTCGQLGLGLKPAASKPASVKGVFYCKLPNHYLYY